MIPVPKWNITCKEDIDEILKNGIATGLTIITIEAQDEYKIKPSKQDNREVSEK